MTIVLRAFCRELLSLLENMQATETSFLFTDPFVRLNSMALPPSAVTPGL